MVYKLIVIVVKSRVIIWFEMDNSNYLEVNFNIIFISY